MYRLTAFRLINWLHFTDITRPLSGTTLLTGENGEGKSTILDALQLALVADLRQIHFNQAQKQAGHIGHSGRDRRTLKGYVLWAEKREEDNAPPRYRRASATSYVLLQFDDKPVAGVLTPPRAPFLCGVAVEAVAKGGEPNRTHVVIPGASLSDFPLLDLTTRLALPMRDFEAAVKQRRGATATSSADAYLDALRFQLDRLPKSLFPSLLTKGLAFKPMASVHDFVTEFLLEPRPIETGRLVDNLVHYQEMKRESERAAARLQAIDRLVMLGEDVNTRQRARDIAKFVYLRAELEEALTEQAFQESLAVQKDLEHADAAERERREAERKAAADQEVERLNRALASDAKMQAKQSLDEEAARIAVELQRADTAEGEVRENLAIQRALLEAVLAPEMPAIVRTDPTFRAAVVSESVIGADPHLPLVHEHRLRLDPHGSLADRELADWTMALSLVGGGLGGLRFALGQRTAELRKEGAALQRQREELAAGRVDYGEHLDALRFGLSQAERRGELRLKRPIVPLCELVDEVEPEWQDAVEAWLGARRFDLMPDPQDYPAVNLWLERHRDACPTSGGGTLRLYGVSIVNTDRVLKHQSRGNAPDPLSDVVRSANPLAQAYLEYLLARVQRCDSVADFGRYELAATRGCLLYRSYRTERMRPPILVLGRAAREAERRRLEQQLGAIARLIAELGPVDQWLRTLEAAYHRAQQKWPLVGDRLPLLAGRGDLEARQARVRHQSAAIDLSHVAGLEHELDVAKLNRDDANAAWLQAHDAAIGAISDAATARDKAQTAAQTAQRRSEDLANDFPLYDADPRWAEHRSRFEERLRETEKGPSELAVNYRRRYAAAMTSANEAMDAFKDARIDYEKAYEPIVADAPVPIPLLREEAERWRSTKLPEYARQIEERIAAARIQLLDDVLAQLHSHFAELKKTLTTLNVALRTCMFGKDQYEFTWRPTATLRPYYDLIVELAPSFDLTGASGSVYEILQDNPVMRERLDQLLVALTDNRSDPLSGLERVRDYREYFDYDVNVMDGQGQIYPLSRNAGIASGGEVQTPTYVALFASIQQMYGATTSIAPYCGLFLVDESFSLLDDRRIPALMNWVHELGLQGILAMPTGREAHFQRYADTILLVSRDTKGYGRVDDAHDLSRVLELEKVS